MVIWLKSCFITSLLPIKYFQKEMPSKFDADPDRVFDEAYGVGLISLTRKKRAKE